MAKSVCIVGAGPAGLAVAKTLLHSAPQGDDFTVTVFDAQHDVGGLWPTSQADVGRQIHPLMLANQSRHTVHFSDLAWDDTAPQLPRAWMIGRYLQRYATRYLTGNPNFQLRLQTRVTRTEQDGDGWNVTVQSDKGEETTTRFDRLVVASGYFGDPVIPKALKDKATIPVIHSSQYRDLQSLLETSGKGGKILVAGGQMSGVEIAATIGTHLSNEINSPDKSSIPNIEKYSIHHASPRHPWVIPLHTTPEPKWKAPPFLPHDLASFNKNNRPVPFTDTQGHISEEKAEMVHERLRGSLGPKQRIGAETASPDGPDRSSLPYLSCSDWYCDFVQSGLITVHNGRLESMAGSTAQLTDASSIEDVAAVVLGTGFDPAPCVSFLPKDVLCKLDYSPAHPALLLALSFHATHHPDLPSLGFVGFYRGAFWGVIQMQARLLAALWSRDGPSDALREKLAKDRSIQRTLDLRADPRMSQFPMGDYPFLMQDFAEALSLTITPPLAVDAPPLTTNGLPLEIFAPCRYSLANEDGENNANAKKLIRDAAAVLQDALTTPRFVSRAVFRSLLGTWKLERDLKSKLPTHPSGHFSGTAQFLLRAPTKEGVQCTTTEGAAPLCQDGESYEYLYIEDGDFTTDQGFGFRATRRYIYRYDEASGLISVWFAKPDDNKRVDYFFHQMEFEAPPAGGHAHGWPAKSGHLCIDDYYNVKYKFVFDAVNLESWVCAYTVHGPQKDYTIHGTYTR